MAKPQGMVLSGNRNPASATRTTGKGSRQKYLTFASPPWPSATGTSTLLPTAPVEPPVTAVIPVEQVVQKRKASLPLLPLFAKRTPHRTYLASRRLSHNTRLLRALPAYHLQHAESKPKAGSRGGLRSTSLLPLITSPICCANRLRELDSLPDQMGKISIGLTGRGKGSCSSLLRSILGDGYGILLPSIISLHNRNPWLQISDCNW